ncbi:HtaA domain-containing protein [Actinokineospora cianjurensis]|uniref:Htaa protein n=1 Tax=Actinokineospora cianjurensis TaxID=585224 RepID=A0A421B1R8_9PSEU|nr:HtaA domain-containing protein [Actinokineospora cianjurensis]RLK58226.1 Htaa protein [Actinokineospora cianjurensis]
MARPHAAKAVAVGAAALLAATVLSATPAAAATATVTDATFVWGLSGYAQVGIFGPWNFKDLTGNTTLLTGSVSGGAQTQYVVAPAPATSMPVSSPQKTPNAVRFTAGTGTVDPATGAGQLSFTGSYTVNAYPPQFNAPNEVYKNPVVTVAADGSGSLTAEFSLGAGIDVSGNPTPAQDFGRLKLVTFDAGSLSGLTATGFRVTPDYQGTEVTVPDGTAQNRTCAAGQWGSWAPEFVTTVPGAVRPHFYSTGCGGSQDYKPALPFDIGYTVATTPNPQPSATEQDVRVTVPQVVQPGEFVWTIDGTNGLVDLGTAVAAGDHYLATGSINPVRVTDTRAGAPAWSVSAQVSDFAANGTSFDGKYLGWTPKATENTGGAVAGAAVASGFDGGAGLKQPATLGSAALDHAKGSVLLGADLSLKVPVSVGSGTYDATLTLTALS